MILSHCLRNKFFYGILRVCCNVLSIIALPFRSQSAFHERPRGPSIFTRRRACAGTILPAEPWELRYTQNQKQTSSYWLPTWLHRCANNCSVHTSISEEGHGQSSGGSSGASGQSSSSSGSGRSGQHHGHRPTGGSSTGPQGNVVYKISRVNMYRYAASLSFPTWSCLVFFTRSATQ
jgi:uncharacterized membrane protein YgcG